MVFGRFKTIKVTMSKIECLTKQALKTFRGCKSSEFSILPENFEHLKSITNTMTAEDVYVNDKVLGFVKWQQMAPMSTIGVYEHEDINIAVFLLRDNVTLPLHDHPKMHGLLKVLSGVVKIDSYTLEKSSLEYKDSNKLISAVRNKSQIVSASDPACVLEPHANNLHEISCVVGPAAFLDVLSPPYHSDSEMDCTYFRVVDSNADSDQVKLRVEEPPQRFYSIGLQYLGPLLKV